MSRLNILMAEDDPDDRFLMEQVFIELGSEVDLRFVHDGEELMDYLRRSGRYADPLTSPRPALIILDLNMPRKDGRQALLEIKANPDLQGIPVAVWTTSEEKDDKAECRKAGADAYVTKPVGYAEIVKSIRNLVARYSPVEQ